MKRESEQTKRFAVQLVQLYRTYGLVLKKIAPGYHNVVNWVFKFLLFCIETPFSPRFRSAGRNWDKASTCLLV